MIAGTVKATASAAIAKMSRVIATSSWRDTQEGRRRNLIRAYLRDYVARDALPGSSAYPHTVTLTVDMVVISFTKTERGDGSPITVPGVGAVTMHASVTEKLAETIACVADGPHELWFNATGDAFVSFEIEADAVLFRLALDA